MFFMEFYYDFAGFVYIMYSLHRKKPLKLNLVFKIENRIKLHYNTPILWNSSLLLVQSRPKAFKAIILVRFGLPSSHVLEPLVVCS